ncbi:MAG TPA: threonine synthase [Clostridia bacterium]|nr:threonine synthase [Clostridia bacterium]
MFYTSTRDKTVKVTASQAITQGISSDGGLFVPEDIPEFSTDELIEYSKLDYIGRAKAILSMYLTDFSQEEIDLCVKGAYAQGKFSSEKVAELKQLKDGVNVLELWKGPTCAFKDMALQLLPHLLTTSAKKTAKGKEIVILVATSGDTGKAALEGFKDVDGTKIMVFYPSDGVSPMQKLQMTTQEGSNVNVCAIEGNFDDAQNGVKSIFTNKETKKKLDDKGMMFSSANSINWGRLAPQIVYYISAYCDLVSENKINVGDLINIVVPTGNFGNILAAYYAKEMGLPIDKLICASNKNNVLTDFLMTGKYDKNRDFHTTSSPSMDILISSNLERLLFLLCGMDDIQVRSWMASLTNSGKYDVGKNMLKKLNSIFAAGFCDDEKTKMTIAKTYEDFNYLCDTHTGVAVNVYNSYREESGNTTPTVIASTASPFKFSASVLNALAPEKAKGLDEFEMVCELSKITGLECPPQLANLASKKVRFTDCCSKDEMGKKVLDLV